MSVCKRQSYDNIYHEYMIINMHTVPTLTSRRREREREEKKPTIIRKARVLKLSRHVSDKDKRLICF